MSTILEYLEERKKTEDNIKETYVFRTDINSIDPIRNETGPKAKDLFEPRADEIWIQVPRILWFGQETDDNANYDTKHTRNGRKPHV